MTACAKLTASASAPRRPSRTSRRQVNNWPADNPYLRAVADTRRGALALSATIRRFSSGVHEARLEKTAAFRKRRAADTARWRERLHRGAAVYPVEVDGTTFDLMERFGGLKDSKTSDRQAVATALGKLLRRALAALLREGAAAATFDQAALS